MCVTSLLCCPWTNLWPFQGLYCKRISLYIHKLFTVQPINRPMDYTGEMKHILCKVSCFLLKSFRFRRFQKRQVFLHTNPYIQNVVQQCRCSLTLIFRAWATCGLTNKQWAIFHSLANKTHSHKKGCAPSLILKVRVFGTRKWPITGLFICRIGDFKA